MIKIDTEINKNYKETTISIKAPEYTKEIENIVNNLNDKNSLNNLMGYKDNKLFILKIKEILYFYSYNKKVYAKTIKDNFEIRNPLYQLEKDLPKNIFIRISNSCIINIDKVECFDLSMIGSITAKMINNDKLIVSRRKVTEVMHFLKERK